jgi:hypothetical protein
MWVSWSSALEVPRHLIKKSVGVSLGLWGLLGLAGCTEHGNRAETGPLHPHDEVANSPHPYPLCIEQLYTAESMAGCRIESYIEFETTLVSPFPFNERQESAARLLAWGEAYFSQGIYHKAWYAFDTARVNLPSYKSVVRAADASFYGYATWQPEGSAGQAQCVELEFPASALFVRLAWHYDAALLFYPFELERTGVTVPQEELDRTRRKSACMKRLANKYQYWLKPCVDRSEILKCLEAPE